LEVGCGNGTNLMVLRRALDERVCLRGIDISAERLRLGREYWGDWLYGVEMVADSATTLATQADHSADLVYSVHCLEQIPYAVDACLGSMARVTRASAVFVEPTWEYANRAQKLCTLFGDQLRTLVPSLKQSDLEIVKQVKAELLANHLNQTGFITASKRG
jgi:ubiquinone/menaquinone biosynthesis C-methylase UbiE